MKTDAFEAFVARYISLGPLRKHLLRTHLRPVRFQAGETILHQGDTCHRLLFITRGVARSMILLENGREETWDFHYYDPDAPPPRLFLVDFESFLRQTPASLHIEALTETEALAIDRSARSGLLARSFGFYAFDAAMAREAYCYAHRQLIMRRTLDPLERYRRFLAEYAPIIPHIPQYQIASWLGITPQHLSRLKKETDSHM